MKIILSLSKNYFTKGSILGLFRITINIIFCCNLLRS